MVKGGSTKNLPKTHSAVLDPEKKPFERLIFPTKYGIPKSSKPFSHWLSKKPLDPLGLNLDLHAKVPEAQWSPASAQNLGFNGVGFRGPIREEIPWVFGTEKNGCQVDG